MKATTILSVAASLLVPAEAYFYAIAVYSGSPIHLQSLNANDGNIWIGKPTTKYCPDVVKSQNGCPDGRGTAFAQAGSALAMAVEVPGGQEVYIDRTTGALNITVPHSEDTYGGIVSGWSHVTASNGTTGELKWRRGLVACPTTTDGVYQVFANVKAVDFSPGCIGPFNAATSPADGVQAWEYI